MSTIQDSAQASRSDTGKDESHSAATFDPKQLPTRVQRASRRLSKALNLYDATGEAKYLTEALIAGNEYLDTSPDDRSDIEKALHGLIFVLVHNPSEFDIQCAKVMVSLIKSVCIESQDVKGDWSLLPNLASIHHERIMALARALNDPCFNTLVLREDGYRYFICFFLSKAYSSHGDGKISDTDAITHTKNAIHEIQVPVPPDAPIPPQQSDGSTSTAIIFFRAMKIESDDYSEKTISLMKGLEDESERRRWYPDGPSHGPCSCAVPQAYYHNHASLQTISTMMQQGIQRLRQLLDLCLARSTRVHTLERLSLADFRLDDA